MEYLDEREYRKALKREINAGKQLAQVYLIIFSFMLPSALTTVAQSKNTEAIAHLPYFASGFIVFIVIYIVVISKDSTLKKFKPISANAAAIIATTNLGFALPLYITFYMSVNGASINSNMNSDFYFYTFSSISLSALFLIPLLITAIRGEPRNEIASELVRARNNVIINDILNWLDFYKLEIIYTVPLYFCYIQTAMRIFKPVFNLPF